MYHEAAELLFLQIREGYVVPAKIINHFTEPEQQREAASLFHTTLPLESQTEFDKALRETIYRVRSNGITHRRALLEPTDMAGLQKSIREERKLAELKNLHISLD